jgi:hypothetical protein
VSKVMEFVAVCQYPGKPEFLFYSDAFHVSAWADVEAVGADAVAISWAAISPHPAPPVVRYLPGALLHDACRHV